MTADLTGGLRAGQSAGTARTTLLGGLGIVLATLPPLAGTLDPTWPHIPGAQPVSWMIFAVALGILAFGMSGESGIVGDSVVGRVALFVFGIHELVLTLASTLTPLPADPREASPPLGSPAAIVGGWAFQSVSIVGLVAAAVAAIVIVRAGILGAPARWALLPVPVVGAVGMSLLFVPAQEVALVGAQFSEATFPLLALVGVAYAVHGRWPAFRRWLAVVNEKW